MRAHSVSNAFAETIAACRRAAAAGALAEALSLAQRAIEQQPHSFDALFLTGVTLQRLERVQESTDFYRRALAVDDGFPEAHHNLGCALLELRQLDAAKSSLERAFALRPDYAATLDGLAFAYAELGEPERAVTFFERSLELDDSSPHVHGRLGNVLLRLQRFPQAHARFSAGLERAPDFPELLDGLGVALDRMGRLDEAIATLRRALALDPTNANAACNLGKVLLSTGDIDEAMLWFDRAIALEPRNGGFYLPLVTGGSKGIDPAHADAMIELSSDIHTLPKLQQIDLHFALGNVYERREMFDEAFAHLRAGNALKRSDIRYDDRAASAAVRSIEAAFGNPLMDALRGCGDPSARPIFIVGMPRSGSTLVEQLLAAHPAVAGAGEIGTLATIVREVWPTISASTIDELRAQVRGIGERYLRDTECFAHEVSFVADKTLENVQLLPLLHVTLPNARIIHIRRNELDTCFSCFATFFSDQRLPFAYDLRELGHYYHAYREMMERWSAFVSPDRLLEIHYEELLGNFEHEARRILAFCGIPWDAACLRFYEARRPVRTASNFQVRQPLYHSSVGRAQPFLAHLGPLIESLNEGAPGV